MEPVPQLSREAYLAAMRGKLEDLLGQVADAVNDPPPGRVIPDSEERVRDLFAAFRQAAYEAALQMRVDAAEAAFPPSEGPRDAAEETQ